MGWKPAALRCLAAFLVLWTPFFVFAAQRDYPIPASSLLLSAVCCLLAAALLSILCGRAGAVRQAILFTVLVGLALDVQFDWFEDAVIYAASAAMLALFWVLRRHIATILIAMFGSVLLSTVAIGALEPYVEVWQTENDAAANHAGGTARGIVVHLLLDEYAGIMGLPEDVPGGRALRQTQREFFTAEGFRLFGKAVSEYEATRNSVSGTLNFTAGPTPYDLYEGKRPFVLQQNRYFEVLAAAGYRIHVYQSTYMDYCREFPALVSSCYTYLHDGTDWMKSATLDDADKLNSFFGMYLRLSDEMVEGALKLYVRLARRLARHDVRLPELPKWDDGPSSVNAAITFDRIIDDIATGSDGTAYFAHLLFPHGPYAFRSDCRLRAGVNAWRSNRPPFRRENSESERRRSYTDYFEQLQCAQRKLDSLFARLKAAGRFEEATIIVHGDHGARIHGVAARAKNIDRLSQRDYLAGFATLFAAKSAAFEAGYDSETAPVSRLLARAIGRADLIRAPEAPITIYLEGADDDEPWTPVPWLFSE